MTIVKKIILGMLWCLAILLIVSALLLNFLRFSLPHWKAPRDKLQQWVSATLHVPVSIGKVDAYWNRLEPVIEFSNVRMLSQNSRVTLGRIHYLQIKIDLLESILHHELLPSLVELNGSQFTLVQNAKGGFELGLGAAAHAQQSLQQGPAVQYILVWLLQQTNLVVRKVDVKVILANHHIMRLKQVALDANRGVKGQVLGDAEILQPAPAHITFSFKAGQALAPNHFYGRLYVAATKIQLPVWLGMLPAAMQRHFPIQHASWGGQLWMHWAANKLQSVQLSSVLQHIVLQQTVPTQGPEIASPTALGIGSISAKAYWQRLADGWQLSLSGLKLQHEGLSLSPYDIAVQRVVAPKPHYVFSIKQFDLQQLQQLYQSSLHSLLPLSFWEMQQQLMPRGVLQQIQGTWQPAQLGTGLKSAISPRSGVTLRWQQALRQLEFKTSQLGWNAYHKIPGLTGLTSQVSYSPGHIQVDFSGQGQVSIWKKDMFSKPLPALQLKGDLNWQQEAKTWKLMWNNFQIQSQAGVAQLSGVVHAAANKDPIIHLQGNFKLPDITKIRSFLPDKKLHPKLRNWLQQAFVAGGMSAGTIAWNGPVNHFPDNHAEHAKTHDKAISQHAIDLAMFKTQLKRPFSFLGKKQQLSSLISPQKSANNAYFKVDFMLNKAQFHYAKQWPNLVNANAHVSFFNKAMVVKMSGAELMGDHVSVLQAKIANLSHAKLELRSQVTGSLKKARAILVQSPLAVGQVFRSMQLDGPLHLNLQLHIPIADHQKKVQVDAQLKTNAATVAWPSWKLQAHQVSGNFRLVHNHLFADDVKGVMFGHPININISSKTLPAGASVAASTHKRQAGLASKSTHEVAQQTLNKAGLKQAAAVDSLILDIKGRANAALIMQHRGLFFAPFVQGDFPYHAQLNIYAADSALRNTLQINSDTRGLAINMPAPFAKPKLKKLPLRAKLSISRKQQQPSILLLHAGTRWSMALALLNKPSGVQISRGQIRLNAAYAQLPKKPGLVVMGSVYKLTWPAWRQYLPAMAEDSTESYSAATAVPTKTSKSTAVKAPIAAAKTATTAEPLLRLVNLQVGVLNYNNFQFKNAGLRLQLNNNNYRLHLDTKPAKGSISIPPSLLDGSGTGTLVLRMQRLKLPLPQAKSVVAKTPKQGASPTAANTKDFDFNDLDPQKIPAIDAQIDDFSYKQHDFGEANLQLHPVEGGVHIDKFNTDSALQAVQLQGSWLVKSKQSHSNLKGFLQLHDVGKVAKEWDVTTMLAGGHGKLDFDLHWPGALLPPLFAKASGTLAVDINYGRFVDLDKATEQKMGLGKLLNLLSLQTLPRRLMLDFSDLTKKGYSFDEMRGQLSFHHGVAKTKDGYLTGPVANVGITGQVDFKKKYYDLNFDVRPHLTSTLPIIAAVAGTPVIGVLTWIVDKAFVGPIVGRIARKLVHAKGYWDRVEDPNVEVYKYNKPTLTLPAPQSSSSALKQRKIGLPPETD